MADVLSATCDFCTVLKGEANHWYRVWKNVTAHSIVHIGPWAYKPPVEHQHACGEDHALKLAARLLGKKNEGLTEHLESKTDAGEQRGEKGDS